MHCEAVDHGTPNLHKDVFYFKYTQEFLPISNFWQLHALPLPSTIKMKSSCPLDIHKYVYMPLPFSLPLSISLPLFSPLPHSPYSPLPPLITLSFLLPISSPPPIPSLSSALIFPLLTNILSAHGHTTIPTLLIFHNDSTFPHQLHKLLHSDVQREARHIHIVVVITVNIKPA